MHKLLQRQLRKLFGEALPPGDEFTRLLETVDQAYQQADADRKLLERSLDLTSRELLEANAELRRDRAALEQRVEERTADLMRLNASLQREIGERKDAETALLQSERRYQILAFNSPGGILHSDAEGRCLYVNRKWCEMSGSTGAAALGSGWLEGVHDSDRERVREEWQRAVSRKVPVFSTEYRFCRPDSRVFWVVGQAVAIRGRDGLPAGYVVTATDITVRKEAEEALRQSEEKFRSLFEDSKDTIYISTPGGKVVDVNPAGVELFGYRTKQEFMAADRGGDQHIARDDRKRLLELVEERGFVKDLELQATRKDGQPLTLIATATPVRDEGGEIIALRGILRDVTEQRDLERRLLEVQKMEAVGRLAGGVAHDFNNLLTAIVGYSELIRGQLEEDDPALTHLDEIRHAGKRGAGLTQQLLAFSRRQVLETSVVNLNRVVTEIESLLERLIGDDIVLITELADDLGSVRVDASQIEQVLLNLVVNARDAMPGGGEVRVRTGNYEVIDDGGGARIGLAPGAYVRVVVEDSGAGIADDIRDQIFEPFFTTKGAGGGTGLGLSTVYGIVQQSGGRIDLSSEPGRGSRFAVYLPQVGDAAKVPEEEPPPEPLPAGTETILLAEDEPGVRRFLEVFLRRLGYNVLSAGDGREALLLASESERRIDLLLSDVVMPRMNGIELARRLRELMPELKVLLISGHTGSRAAEMPDPGTDAYEFLQKPFATSELGAKLRELLEPVDVV